MAALQVRPVFRVRSQPDGSFAATNPQFGILAVAPTLDLLRERLEAALEDFRRLLSAMNEAEAEAYLRERDIAFGTETTTDLYLEVPLTIRG